MGKLQSIPARGKPARVARRAASALERAEKGKNAQVEVYPRTWVMKDTILPKRLLRKRAMAESISISVRKLEVLMKKRIVPFSRIDGLILFDPERVLEAIALYERKTATRQN